jgi:acyl-CoA thioesterase FadM
MNKAAGTMTQPIAADGATAPFVHARRLTFGDTDAAGIIYTPRVAHFGVEAVEAWFLERLGVSWLHINRDLGMGTPVVRLEVDFVSMMEPPDMLHTEVRLTRIGRSSLGFALTGRIGERLCWQGKFTFAFVSTTRRRSVPIPEQHRDALARERAIAAGG